MENRLTKLESTVEHIHSEVTEIKGDIRRLDGKIDAVKDSLAAQAVSTEKSFSRQVVWIVGVAAALLTAMARGFHWL